MALGGTVSQATRLLDLSEKGFEYGVKTRLDVEDAELNLRQAKGNLARARHYLVARVNLEFVKGTLEEDGKRRGPGKSSGSRPAAYRGSSRRSSSFSPAWTGWITTPTDGSVNGTRAAARPSRTLRSTPGKHFPRPCRRCCASERWPRLDARIQLFRFFVGITAAVSCFWTSSALRRSASLPKNAIPAMEARISDA